MEEKKDLFSRLPPQKKKTKEEQRSNQFLADSRAETTMEVVGIVRIIISPGGFLIGRQVVSRNVDVNGAQGTDPCAQHHLHLRTGWRVAAPRTPFHGR